MNGNSIKILCLLLVSSMANCQVTTTVPLNTYNYPNGAYIKDLNNVLPFWEGTWEGVESNKKYTFIFTLFRQQLINHAGYHYIDEIKGKFKVVNLSTNQVLYDNLNVTSYNDYNIVGLSIIAEREFQFYFYDNEINCFNSAIFSLIKSTSSNTQINYKGFRLSDFGGPADCSYENQSDIPMFLPRVDLVLNKQK